MPTSSWPRLFLAAIGLVFSIPGSTNHAPALHTISLLLPPTLAEFDSRWSTRHRCLFCPLFVIFLSAFCTYTAWQVGGGGRSSNRRMIDATRWKGRNWSCMDLQVLRLFRNIEHMDVLIWLRSNRFWGWWK